MLECNPTGQILSNISIDLSELQAWPFNREMIGKEPMGFENALNSKPDYVNLVNLIRSVQRAEGNNDCYRRGLQQCERMDCVWRDHCLKAPEEPSNSDIADAVTK